MSRSPTKRDLRKAATRAAVIEAASTVFASRGYEGATITDIAREANVSPGTVLNAAPTKIAILNEVMVEDFTALGSACETLRATLNSPYRDKVAALLELHLQRHCDTIELISALLGHTWIDGAAEFDALSANLDLAWAPILEMTREQHGAGQLRGEFTPEQIVTALQDVYIGVVRRYATRPDSSLFAASSDMRLGVAMVLDGALV